jgi:hypothetical protein
MMQPIYSPHPTKKLVVLQQDYWFDCYGLKFGIKAGYAWDGASIPFIGYFIINRTPFDPRVILFSLGHDALFDFGITSRQEANDWANRILGDRNGWYVRWAIRMGLLIGSKRGWDRRRRLPVMKQREFYLSKIQESKQPVP